MRKAKQVNPWPTYEAIRDEMGETNDCTVVSLAQVLDVPYEAAHEAMARLAGRENGKGASPFPLAMRFPSVFVQVPLPRDGDITLAEFCRVHSVGRYWVGVDGHQLAVINGKVVDHSRRVRRRVWSAHSVFRSKFEGFHPPLCLEHK